ncbi:MAG: MmcQ/YjbR family DNA-binding protein [Candidatus Limnocylindrales bacterium]
MTGGEVRALCLSLPETTEKETWGDEDNPGHPTFRVRDKIYVIMAVDETAGRIKTSMDEQGALIGAFPDAASIASHVGRFGWVVLVFDQIPDVVLRETIEGAWARTAPKKLAAAWRGAR